MDETDEDVVLDEVEAMRSLEEFLRGETWLQVIRPMLVEWVNGKATEMETAVKKKALWLAREKKRVAEEVVPMIENRGGELRKKFRRKRDAAGA